VPLASVVTVSSRLPGLLSPAGWRAVSGGRPLAALPGAAATADALRADGWEVADLPDVAAAMGLGGEVVVLAAPGETDAPDVVAGAPEPAGVRLLDVVAVMDRLRSPGGCPWDAEQTHESLVRYLIEEAYEVAEAIETGDRAHLVEELGDVLLQVVFHSRVAAEDPDVPFTVDDVADGIVAKLVGRHPHVFADPRTISALDVEGNWEQLKAAEKGRTSVLDGIPPALPALMYAEKVLARAARTGVQLASDAAGALNRTEAADAGDAGTTASGITSEEALGRALLDLVAQAHRSALDPEAALRRAVRELVRTATAG
jgi:XTP/dITP diphosphohydrolase